ncbi:MAG TPA: ABC transporter permease subunit [Clostridia bacterium]|nr:ABC transporter permease subunit [Clostridia bacterium]
MIILKREMNRNMKALIIWTLVISGITILNLMMFPEVAEQQSAIDQLIKQMPESLIKAFGMDRLSMADPLGYYATKGYIMIILFGSIYAVMLAGNMLSKEHNEKTIEFILSKPITRSGIVTQKLLAVFINLLIFNLAITAANYLGFRMADAEFDMNIFLLLSVAPFLLHLVFASISFLLSSQMKKSRNIVSISLGLVFVMYFIDIMSSISGELENLKYVTPYEYVDAVEIVINKSINTTYLGIMAGVISLCALASYLIYRRRDIAV